MNDSSQITLLIHQLCCGVWVQQFTWRTKFGM